MYLMCYESGKQLQMIKREREEEGDRQKQCPVKKMSICGKYELKF